MDVEDRIKEMTGRLLTIEAIIHKVAGGVLVGGVLVLGMLGYTNWIEVPNKIKSEVSRQIGGEVERYVDENEGEIVGSIKVALEGIVSSRKSAADYESEAKKSADSANALLAELSGGVGVLRVERGKLSIRNAEHPVLLDNSECANRGEMDGWVEFKKTFSSKPEIVAGLSRLDADESDNVRIEFAIKDISEEGFRYTFHTWCKTKLYSASVYWLAVGN